MDVDEDFAPIHRKRIKDAVEQLPRPSEKTGLSFAASDMFLNEKPSEPASNSQTKEMAMIRQHMDWQRKESGQENERKMRENAELKKQLKQDREQSKQEMGKLKEQNERLLAKLDQEGRGARKTWMR
ncbi:hypothetical protein MMC31_004929 [Peltigera leucophlebia]|nr:hypothetical protein [Peltigera leucophlebia]